MRRGRRFQNNPGNFHGYSASTIKCFYCNKIGHYVQDCWIRQSDVKNGNNSESNYASNSTTQVDEHDENACDKNALVVTIGKSANNARYLNFGGSNHRTGDYGLFDATKSLSTPIEICMGDDACYDVKSHGDVQLHLWNDMSKKLNNVLYVPGVQMELMSICQLVKKDMDVLFNKFGCTITSSNTVKRL